MIYGIYHSAAGLQIQDYRQSLIANNLANADTPGFKPDSVAIIERDVAAVEHGDPRVRHRIFDRLSGGLWEAPVQTDFAPGELDITNNPLDLAIVGDGFLRVATGEGERFTRDGRLSMNADGTLVAAGSGFPVLSDAGEPIRVDPTAPQKIEIDGDGSVRQGRQVVGRMALVDFDDRQRLQKTGRNLFEAPDQSTRAARGEIRSGAVEQSTADPVQSLVQMIAAGRAYELNANLIAMQDNTLGKVVNELGRLG